MSDPAWQLQVAIRAALIADTALASAMGGVPSIYDNVPERAEMPYLVIDEPGTAEWDVTPTEADDGYGKEHTAMLHTWSAYEGKEQTNAMLRAIELALRDFAPALEDHRVVNFRFQFMDRLADPDGQAYHGVIQFRAITEELA